MDAEEAIAVRYELATPEPPRIRGGIAAGLIEIETADTAETVVEVEAIRGDVENLKVEQHGRDIVVESRKRLGILRDAEYHVHIRTSHGAEVDLNVASADIRASGRYGAVEMNTASGDVEADSVERDAKIRSASGDVQLGEVGGRVDVTSASGDVRILSAGGGATVRSASGHVQIGEGRRRIVVQTASGDQQIEAVAEGSVDLKSASGDVRLGVRRGSRLFVDARSMSGETSSEIELLGAEAETDGPLVELKAATMSGDIRIVRA
jgi:DUF4097 and DUF4098 domain-containing protein YvlB